MNDQVTRIKVNENPFTGVADLEISAAQFRDIAQPISVAHSWNTVSTCKIEQYGDHTAPVIKPEDFISIFANVTFPESTIYDEECRIFWGQIKAPTMKGTATGEGVEYLAYGPRQIARRVQIDNRYVDSIGEGWRLPIRIYNAQRGDSDYKRSQNYLNREYTEGWKIWTVQEILEDLFDNFTQDKGGYKGLLSIGAGSTASYVSQDFTYNKAFENIKPPKIVFTENDFTTALLQILAVSSPALRCWPDPRNLKWRFINLLPWNKNYPTGGENMLRKRTLVYTRSGDRPLSNIITPNTEEVFTAYEVYGKQIGASVIAKAEIRNGVSVPFTDPLGNIITLAYGDWYTGDENDAWAKWTLYSSNLETDEGEVLINLATSPDSSTIVVNRSYMTNEWTGSYIELFRGENNVGVIAEGRPIGEKYISGTVTATPMSDYGQSIHINSNENHYPFWHHETASYEPAQGDTFRMDKDPYDEGGTVCFYRCWQILINGEVPIGMELSEKCCNQLLFGYYQTFGGNWGGGGHMAWSVIPFYYYGDGLIVSIVPLYEGDPLDPPVTLPKNLIFNMCYVALTAELKVRVPDPEDGMYTGTAAQGHAGYTASPGEKMLPDSLKLTNPIGIVKRIFIEEFGADPELMDPKTNPDQDPDPDGRWEEISRYSLAPLMNIPFEGSTQLDKIDFFGVYHPFFKGYGNPVRTSTFGIWCELGYTYPEGAPVATTGYEDLDFFILQITWNFLENRTDISFSTDARSFGGDEFKTLIDQLIEEKKMRATEESVREFGNFLACYGGEGFWPGGGGYGGGKGGGLTGGGGGAGGRGGRGGRPGRPGPQGDPGKDPEKDDEKDGEEDEGITLDDLFLKLIYTEETLLATIAKLEADEEEDDPSDGDDDSGGDEGQTTPPVTGVVTIEDKIKDCEERVRQGPTINEGTFL